MDEYRVQASPTTPAKLPMLPQGVGVLKEGCVPQLAPKKRILPDWRQFRMSPVRSAAAEPKIRGVRPRNKSKYPTLAHSRRQRTLWMQILPRLA